MSEILESSVLSSRKKLNAGIVPLSVTLISARSDRCQPAKLIADAPGLCSSIHSSVAEANVPAHAISLIKMDWAAYGVGGSVGGSVAGVDGAVAVAEGEPVAEGSSVRVPDAVRDGEAVDETEVGVAEIVADDVPEGCGEAALAGVSSVGLGPEVNVAVAACSVDVG